MDARDLHRPGGSGRYFTEGRMRAWLLVVATLVGGISFAAAGEIKMTFTHPSTNVDGTPLTDLRSEKVYTVQVPQNIVCQVGELQATGREGSRDSFILKLPDQVHYVQTYLRPTDMNG